MDEQNSSISSFKRFFGRILLPLILSLGVVGVIFNYFFEKAVIFNSEQCGAYKVHRILTETHPDEIPIFGSSRAEGGFIPDSLAPGCFNYGITGTKYDVTLFFLNEECKKKKTRPWVILDLDLDGIIHETGDIANYIPDARYDVVRKLLGKDFKPAYRIPFIKYYGFFETYARNFLNSRIQLTKFSNKGAALEKNAMPRAEFDQLVAERRNSTSSFEEDSALTTKLFDLIKTHTDRTFIFVIAPYHNSYFEKYTNPGDADRFMAMLRSYKNVKVFDFSKLALPDDMYLNTTHVNYKGAIVFNRELRDSLISIGVR